MSKGHIRSGRTIRLDVDSPVYKSANEGRARARKVLVAIRDEAKTIEEAKAMAKTALL